MEGKSGEITSGVAGRGIDLWQELPRICVMIMELSWVVPCFQLITLAVNDQPAWVIGLILFIVWFLAYALAKAVFQLSIKDKIRQRLFLIYIVAAVFFSEWMILYRQTDPTDLWRLYNQSLDAIGDVRELVPPEVMVFLVILFVVRRGFSVGRDWGGAYSVMNSIKISIAAYFLLGIMARSAVSDVIQTNLFIFLVTAIFGMLTARIGSIRKLRGGRGGAFDLRWLGGILASTILITGVTAAFAIISSSQIETLNQALKAFIYTVLYLVTTPFITLASRIFPALESLKPVWPTIENEQEDTTELSGQPDFSASAMEQTTDSNVMEVLLQLRFLMFAVILLVAMVMIVRMAQRWRGGAEHGPDDERNSILDGRGLLRWMLDALRSRAKSTADSLVQAAHLNRRERMRAAARIRRIYADFMDLCEDVGLVRADSQTPHEFLPQTASLFSQTYAEIGLITESYQRVRYGEFPETHQEVLDVEQAWSQVREAGEAIRKGLTTTNRKKT